VGVSVWSDQHVKRWAFGLKYTPHLENHPVPAQLANMIKLVITAPGSTIDRYVPPLLHVNEFWWTQSM
jgi:hypothetical protein